MSMSFFFRSWSFAAKSSPTFYSRDDEEINVIVRSATVHKSNWLTRHWHLPPATIPARYISIGKITLSRSRVCSRPGHNAIRISPVEEGEED